MQKDDYDLIDLEDITEDDSIEHIRDAVKQSLRERMAVDDSFINKAKRLYTIRLKSGIVVSVLEKGVQGHMELNAGDRAAVLITDIKPEGYAFGMAMKI